MLDLRYSAGFLTCFDFRIHQSSEYTQGYTRFWIKYFMIDVRQNSEYALDSEYATVLNILGLRSLWIKFSIICISQSFEYASSSEYTSVTQGSVLNSLPYIFARFLSILCALNMPGLEYTRVVNMLRFCVNCILKILDILNVLSFEYAKV